jgi:hypothetical protein
MHSIFKGKQAISLVLLVIFLTSVSYSNASGGSVGSYSQNKYSSGTSAQPQLQANLLVAAAFVVGAVTGFAVGVVEGFTATQQLVAALGAETVSSLSNINYEKNNLSQFDPS